MEHQNLILQPGAFRTEACSATFFAAEPIPDYNEAREVARKRMNAIAGTEIGDPAKGMELLLTLLEGRGSLKEGMAALVGFGFGCE